MKICENCQKVHDGLYGSGRFCSTECARGFSTKDKRKEINETVGKKLSLLAHKDLEKICPECNQLFKICWKKREQIVCSRKCARAKLNKNVDYINKLKNNAGGYRERGGRGIQGYFQNIYCNSSWELAYLIYCFDHNLKIKRNIQGFQYIFQGQIFKYYPDFIKESIRFFGATTSRSNFNSKRQK